MQIKPEPAGKDRSFTAQARRAQIVEATIETIAEFGYAQTSFGRIAERANLSSTRLISYHFAGKQELMAQVAADLYRDIAEFMTQRLIGQRSASGALRGYIKGNIEYVATHRVQMKALLDIFLSGVLSDGEHPTADLVSVGPVEQILRDGQAAGEFRDFDPAIVAACVQRSIDAVPMLLQTRPDLDLAACAEEMTTLFELATRAEATAGENGNDER
jgi:AcrR family transcriptional regulator